MYSGRASKYDWSTVDWDMTSVEISKIIGCCVSTVRRHRPTGTGRKYTSRKSSVDWSRANWSLTDGQIARKLGCTPSAVTKHRVKMANGNPAAG